MQSTNRDSYLARSARAGASGQHGSNDKSYDEGTRKDKLILGLHLLSTYGGLKLQLHHSQLKDEMEVSYQLQAPAALNPGKQPSIPIVYKSVWA
jgi:hypothetical protein